MIYIDTSVALAQILSQDRVPDARLWNEQLIASRLLEYEVWNRLHARGLGKSHAEVARSVIGEIAFMEMNPLVLARALEPFPVPVRTLDALHLASLLYLHEHGQTVLLASYDERMLAAAKKLGLASCPV